MYVGLAMACTHNHAPPKKSIPPNSRRLLTTAHHNSTLNLRFLPESPLLETLALSDRNRPARHDVPPCDD
jgi:hypothetical protein